MGRKLIHNPDQVIEAIRNTGGIKKDIAARLGVSRWTLDNYIERWAVVRSAYNEECEAVLDLAETKLIEEINLNNFQAIKFILSTKGKHRGYVERQEITGPDGDSLTITIIEAVAPNDTDPGPA